MKSIEQLEAELKVLIDGEIARMEADFQRTMKEVNRRLTVIALLLGLLVIYERWIYPWLLARLVHT